MADVFITDYTTLRDAIAIYMAREGSTRFTDQTSLFVQLTEAEVNRRLRVSDQSIAFGIAFTAGDGVEALPSDFAGMRGLPNITTDFRGPLEYYAPAQFDFIITDPSARDIPAIFTIRANNLEVKPLPEEDVTITIYYYQKVPALTTSATTNWLVTNHPDIYLAGSMHHAHSRNSNAQKAGEWYAKFESGMESLEDADWNDRWSASPLISQPRTTEGAASYPRIRHRGRF